MVLKLNVVTRDYNIKYRINSQYFFLENDLGRNGDHADIFVALTKERFSDGRTDEDYKSTGWCVNTVALGPILEWPVESLGEPPEGLL